MKKRILVVDDAMFMRNLIKDALVSGGYEICGEAGTAKEGVAKYRELKPDLMTLDIIMPGMEEMDGIAAVKEILITNPQANVIVVSSLAERALVQQALSHGARDFVAKPFSKTRLVEVVKRILDE